MKSISQFVHYTKARNDDIIVLDTLNGKIYRIDADASERFIKALEQPEKISDDDVLVKKHIVVEHDFYDNRESLYYEFLNKKDYLHLVILPTEDCNFRCTYCYEEHRTRVMTDEVMSSIIKYVEKHIRQYNALRIEWFGGEPLYAKNVVFKLSEEFIRICKRERKPYYASMTTNGYYLDLDTFRTLLKYKVLRYQITIDGLKPYHDKQRFLQDGSGTFDTILHNLRNIRDSISSSFFNITIRCNITAENRAQFSDYLDFMRLEFANDIRFGFLWKIAWNPDSSTCDTYLKQTELHSILEESSSRKLNLDTIRRQLNKFGNICYACNKNSLIVGPHGNLYKCTVALDKDINKVGHLLDNGEVIIDQTKFKFWTERKTSCGNSICDNCYLYPICLGIYCNLNNQDETGKFMCSGFKAYVDDYLNCIAEHGQNIERLEY